MDYIKEVTPQKHCVVRTLRYGSSMTHINSMLAEALQDFPDLNLDDVKVVHYGGIRYKGTFGLEFVVSGSIPESYNEIVQLEYML